MVGMPQKCPASQGRFGARPDPTSGPLEVCRLSCVVCSADIPSNVDRIAHKSGVPPSFLRFVRCFSCQFLRRSAVKFALF